MQLTKNYSNEIVKSATMLLSTICPDLNATSLIGALKAYGEGSQPKSPQVCSIKEASEILGVTTMTVSRYLNDGTLTRISIPNKRFVRISRDEINALLTVGA